MDMQSTNVSRACDLLLSAEPGRTRAEILLAGMLLANTLRGLFVLRNVIDGIPSCLVPPIDQYGDNPKHDYTVLFLCRADAEAAKKYEEEERELHLRIEPLSEIPEIEDLYTC